MKIIRCKNIIIEQLKPCYKCNGEGNSGCELCNGSGYLNNKTAGKKRECGRIIGFLTDMQFDMLKLDPEGIICRCPMCPPDQRWSKVFWDAVNKKLVYSVIQNPEMDKFENIMYDELEICEQVS